MCLNLLIGLFLFAAVVLNGMAVWRAWCFIKNRSRVISEASTTRGDPRHSIHPENFRDGFLAKAGNIDWQPPVTLMVPVCGIEADGVAHFSQFCRLNWPQYQAIFTVLDAMDPALPMLQQIQPFSGCEVKLQVGGPATCANLKIRNLLNAFPSVRYEWIVICDADVQPDPDFLENLMAPFHPTICSDPGKEKGDREVGLVHSLYRRMEDPTMASSWENVWINCDFWVQGLLGEWLRGSDFAFGAAMAIQRKTLEQIGGLEAICDYLADDYQLGHRVAALKKSLVFNPKFVTLQTNSQTWSETWKHLTRWSRTIRVCRPLGYAGSIITNIPLFALLGLFVDPAIFLPWSGLAILLRVAWANQCRNWILNCDGLWRRWWLVLFKDMAQVALWVLAFRNAPIEWRGVRYRLRENGKLVALPRNLDKLSK